MMIYWKQAEMHYSVLVILGVRSKTPDACFQSHVQFHVLNDYSFSLLFLLISCLFSLKQFLISFVWVILMAFLEAF